MPINGKPNGRFELPALSPINFNLTDGTDIPPPPESPIEEEKPKPTTAPATAPTQTPTPQTTNPAESTFTPPASASATKESDLSHLTTTKSNGVLPSTSLSPRNNPPSLRVRAPSDATPNSPPRPNSSIRKFLSRKSLNTNYTNGSSKSHEDLTKMARPESPSSFVSSKPSLMKRKSGSWFRSFGASNKRNSVVYEEKPFVQSPTLQQSPDIQKENTKPGPPPPKLPELNQLKAKIADDDEGSLGGDEMFRNIS